MHLTETITAKQCIAFVNLCSFRNLGSFSSARNITAGDNLGGFYSRKSGIVQAINLKKPRQSAINR